MTAPPGGARVPVALVGDGVAVPCITGETRPYLNLDAAASTTALPAVAARVNDFLPWYSSVHRGAGYKSRLSTVAYEASPGGRPGLRRPATDGDDVAILCRNTTEAINHLAYRLRLRPDDVVVTTVVEHHANLLPWARVCRRRFVECGTDGTFGVDDVIAALDATPRPGCSPSPVPPTSPAGCPPSTRSSTPPTTVTSRSSSTPPSSPPTARCPQRADYLAWSGHKMYAPFGGGVLIGPRATFADGDPFLAGGGAVDLVDLDEVVWTDPPEREEAGSPNVIGAVALHAAIDELARIGWADIVAHDDHLAGRLRRGLAGMRRSAPPRPDHHAHPPDGHLHRRRRAPRPGRGPPQRRIRHRGPPRLLLRPPLPDAPPRAQRRLSRRLPAGPPCRRPPPHPRRGASQLRDQHHGPPTSTGSSTRSPRSPTADRRSPTSRTRPPGTTGPKPTRPDGPYAIRVQVPRARADDPNVENATAANPRQGEQPMTYPFACPQHPRSFR